MAKSKGPSETDIMEMVAELKHLMSNEERPQDFSLPSMLKEVPSFTSTDSVPLEEVPFRAQLGGSSH